VVIHFGFRSALVLAKLNTFALVGIDALPVEAEVDNSPAQMAKTVLVGLPEASVRESIHRIERAMYNLGYQLPDGRTVINLAPADLRKDAGAFDLPIALGLLVSTRQLRPEQLDDSATIGELALDGMVRPVKGALSMAMAARDLGFRRLIVPVENAREAAVVEELQVFGVGTLNDAVGLLSGRLQLEPAASGMSDLEPRLNKYDVDFADVRGQETAKRALTVAAAGGHNLLMLWTVFPKFPQKDPPGLWKAAKQLAKRIGETTDRRVDQLTIHGMSPVELLTAVDDGRAIVDGGSIVISGRRVGDIAFA